MSESIESYLARRAEEVNHWLDCLLPSESVPPVTLHRAMRYSIFGGGKRLRPTLVLAAGEALDGDTDDLMTPACAMEMIHTYSLIHDDLPSMDNDDLRRGRPTCHRAFSEAIAVLAGDALLTQAFRILSAETPTKETTRQLRTIREISNAAGSVDALIGGQVADVENEGRTVDGQMLEYIHRSKTGAMIRASVVVGGISAGATEEQIEHLSAFGERLGLAFQITDDILDVTSTSEQLGKTAGKDEKARKATYPALHGIEASERKAIELIDDAVTEIEFMGSRGSRLKDLAQFVIARKS